MQALLSSYRGNLAIINLIDTKVTCLSCVAMQHHNFFSTKSFIRLLKCLLSENEVIKFQTHGHPKETNLIIAKQ